MLKYLISLSLFATMSASSKEIVEYDWLTMGEVTGSQKVQYENNNVSIHFEFSDRGLGPKLVDKISLSEKDVIVKQELSGNSFMGTEVSEIFTLIEKTATWKSDLEAEVKKLKHDSYFYIAANPTPRVLELLIEAIKKTKKQSISLLPSGIANVQKLVSVEVAASSEQKTVTLHAITGLGYTPDYVWLDSDNRLFAVAYGSMSMVRRGWSSAINMLQSKQDEVFDTYMQTVSKELTEKSPKTTVINNVNIFNSIDSQLQKDMQVVIKGGRIIEINSTAKLFKNANQIHGYDKTLMAGLWDMHVHTKLEDGLFNIASGVTNVRDMGSVYKELVDIKKSFDTNKVIGPNIHAVGLIDKKTDSSAPTGKLVESLHEAIAAVDWYFE